jgi:hypothetical protein
MPLTRHPLPPRIVLLAAAILTAAVVATVAAVLDCTRAHGGSTARTDPALFNEVVEGPVSRIVTVRLPGDAGAGTRGTRDSPAGAAVRRSGGWNHRYA